MKKKEINYVHLTDNYNRYQERCLGRVYTVQEMYELLKEIGIPQAMRVLYILYKKEYLTKRNVAGKNKFCFNNKRIIANSFYNIIEEARKESVDAVKKKTSKVVPATPVKPVSVAANVENKPSTSKDRINEMIKFLESIRDNKDLWIEVGDSMDKKALLASGGLNVKVLVDYTF